MMKRSFAQLAVIAVGALALMGLGAVSSLIAGHEGLTGVELAAETADSAAQSGTVEGQLKATQAELERAHRILEFSGRYSIPADLSALIYDHAVAEGIPPALGFQLVKIESDFKNSAQSYRAAIGLTQLQLLTARAYDPTVDPSDLMNPSTNLRIGFRYLKDLMERFDNDLALALEAYNKGPTLVTAQMEQGENVRGKYSQKVMRGIRAGT